MSSENISYFEKTNLLAYMISACRVDHHAWFFLCKDSEDQMTARVQVDVHSLYVFEFVTDYTCYIIDATSF
jgi:hypothetical protein